VIRVGRYLPDELSAVSQVCTFKLSLKAAHGVT
jgi:hypothetical protein